MADYNLGTARGVIELTYRDNGAPKKAEQGLGAVGKAAKLAQGAAVAGAAGITAGFAAIAGGVAVAVNSAATFQQKMSTVQAVSGATASQMDQLRAKALQLGKDTQYSSSEAADAIGELAKAGISLPDILNGAADATVSLAAAGGVDLPTAATIASNAMNQFRLNARELPRVADLLAGAANASAIDVTDLGNSLAYVGPVANALGVSLQDTSTALAVLGNQGIKGSSGGTALRSILSQLTPTTKIAKEQFQQLGIITKDGGNQFYTASGKVKPLNQVIDVLHNAMKGLTKQQQITFAKKAFGLEDLAAVSILAGQTGKSFDNMTASINKVKAADVAKTRMDNLKGSVEQLKGSGETLAIQIGTLLLPVLKRAADGANGFVGRLIDATDKIPSLISEVQRLASQALAVLTKAWNSTVIQRYVDSVVRLYNVLHGPLESAFHAILSVVLALAPVVGGAIYAAFIALSYVMQGAASTAEFVSRNIKTIGIVAAAAAAVLSPILIVNAGLFVALGAAALASAVRQAAAWATSSAGAVRNAAIMLANSYRIVGQWIAMGAAAIASAARQTIAFALTAAGWVRTGASAVIGAAQVVASWIATGAAAVAGAARSVGSLILMAAQWVIAGAASLAGAAQVALAWIIALGPIALLIAAVIAVAAVIILNWTRINNFLRPILTSIGNFFVSVWNGIKSVVSSAINFIVNLFKQAWPLLLTLVTGPLVAIALYVARHWSQVKAIFSSALNTIKSVVSAGFNAVKSAISAVVNAIRSNLQGQVNGIVAIFNGVRNIVGIVSNAFQSAYNAVVSKVSAVVSYVRGLPGRIQSGLGSLTGLLVSAGEDIIRGLITGMGNMVGAAVQKVKDVASSVVNGAKGLLGIHSPSKVFHEIGQNVSRGFANGIAAGQAAAARAARNAAQAAVDAAKLRAAAKKTLSTQGVSIVNAINAGIARKQIGSAGIESRIQTFLKQLNRAQQSGVRQGELITGVITRDNNKLLQLTNQRAAIATKFAAAQKSLANYQKLYNDTKSNVAQAITAGFDITQTNGSLTNVIANIKDQVAQAKTFSASIATLIKKGFNRDQIAKLAEAGPLQASDQINSLLQATPAQVKEFNGLIGQLNTTASGVGTSVANSLYGAGVRAAQGLVNGLAAQQSKIQAQMNKIAASMVAVIKKALGIRSPSRVFHGFGLNTLQGFVNGIRDQLPVLTRTMSDVVATANRPVVTVGATVGAGNRPFSTGSDKNVKQREKPTYQVTVHRASDRPTEKVITDELRRIDTLYGDASGGY